MVVTTGTAETTSTFKGGTDLRVWDNGFSEQKSSGDGIREKMALLILCSFATVIQVWGRLISGNTRNRGRELPSLTCDFSSAVIDHFCSRRQDVTVAGLYCDYLDRNEQTTVRTGIIGPDSRTLELPLLVWFGSFFFFFCLKLGLRRSLFAVRSPPYPREGISNVLARGPIIPVSTVHRTC